MLQKSNAGEANRHVYEVQLAKHLNNEVLPGNGYKNGTEFACKNLEGAVDDIRIPRVDKLKRYSYRDNKTFIMQIGIWSVAKNLLHLRSARFAPGEALQIELGMTNIKTPESGPPRPSLVWRGRAAIL